MNSLLHHHKTPNRLPLIREEPAETGVDVQPGQKVEKRRLDVLRLGETIESFFLLTENSSPGYGSLCRQLVASPTPTLWKKVLAMTTSSSMDDNSHLLRLYRRGTFLFPLDGPEQTLDVLAIWLDYARVQPANEAKRTLQFVGNYVWTQSYAAYFLCRAAVEPHRAYEYLSQGLESTAEPSQDLQEALRSLQENNDDEPTRRLTTSRRAISSPMEANAPVKVITPGFKEAEPRKGKDTCCKGVRSEEKSRDGVVQLGLHRNVPTPSTTSKHTGINLGCATAKPTRSRLDKEVSDRLVKRNTTNDPDATNKLQSSKKPPLAVKFNTPTLLSKSKAPKAGTDDGLSYILNWDPIRPTTNTSEKGTDRKRASNEGNTRVEPPASSPPRTQRFNRKDLDYMFNWNPAARKSITKEVTKEVTASGSSHGITASNDSALSNQCGKEFAEPSSSCMVEQKPTQDADSSAVDADFLPLVRRENIVRVNNIPYMKLGVIGKGGSCKVFRVMSKEGTILALKKVKVENLDTMAIEGYANEIALLKRLSKNPAIIHLHDSEVVANQAIYLVMEVGEVDLNHVLQKHNKDGGLNINFIRLTWMQMLKAVHSMHEERIIHGAFQQQSLHPGSSRYSQFPFSGDLKPANFLFVKGSLKLIDFGIAKSMESEDTINVYRSSAVGTFNYMSPESLLDSGVDPNEKKMRCGRVRVIST
jgi:Protein kinase domain